MARIFINLGKRDGINPKALISLMNSHVHHRIEVGRIDLLATFSFFEVPEREAKFVIMDMNGADYRGQKVSVSIANGGGDSAPMGKKGAKRGPKTFKEYQNEPDYVGGNRKARRREDAPQNETKRKKKKTF